MKVGYYRRRDKGLAYVGGNAPFDCEFQVVGWSWDQDEWRHYGWTHEGHSFTDVTHDLVTYLGETLRRLPDSPGWWWYQAESGCKVPWFVEGVPGSLHVQNKPVTDLPGVWGDKIEPSGFDLTELRNLFEEA